MHDDTIFLLLVHHDCIILGLQLSNSLTAFILSMASKLIEFILAPGGAKHVTLALDNADTAEILFLYVKPWKTVSE
jgi:hypothetical protein